MMYNELCVSKLSQAEAALQLYNSGFAFLCKLLKSRYEIKTSCTDNESMTRKRKQSGKDEEVDRALKKWFMNVQKEDVLLMKQKAEELAQKIRKGNFHATNGWFSRWLKKENVT